MAAKKANNVAALAKLFGITERAVYELQKQGVIPPPADGQYAVPTCVMAYIVWLKDDRFVGSSMQLAELLGMTEAGVLKMAREEDMPRIKRGKYDFRECVQWYVNKFRRKAMGEETNGLAEETLLHRREQRLMAQLQRKREERKLVDRDESIEGYTSLAGMFISELDALAGRLAPIVVAAEGPDEARHMIRKETHRIREYLATEVRKIAETLSGDSGEDH